MYMEYGETGKECIDCPYANDHCSDVKLLADIEGTADIVERAALNQCIVHPMCRCGGQYHSCSNPVDFLLAFDLYITEQDIETGCYTLISTWTREDILYRFKDGYITKCFVGSYEEIRMDTVEEFIEDLENEKKFLENGL